MQDSQGPVVNIRQFPDETPAATLPGPLKLERKAGEVHARAMDDEYEKQRGLGEVAWPFAEDGESMAAPEFLERQWKKTTAARRPEASEPRTASRRIG
jgi:hypothetical protein